MMQHHFRHLRQDGNMILALDIQSMAGWLDCLNYIRPVFLEMGFISPIYSGYPISKIYVVLKGFQHNHDLLKHAFPPRFHYPCFCVQRAFQKLLTEWSTRSLRNLDRYKWFKDFPLAKSYVDATPGDLKKYWLKWDSLMNPYIEEQKRQERLRLTEYDPCHPFKNYDNSPPYDPESPGYDSMANASEETKQFFQSLKTQ